MVIFTYIVEFAQIHITDNIFKAYALVIKEKLFVYNHHGNVHEMEPICVLDFYVHESRQRMGCGRKLFDYMLHVSFIYHS